MKITKEEVKLVKNNIEIFNGEIEYEKIFSKSMLRRDQHGLFFVLLDTNLFPLLKKSVKLIKDYKKGTFFKKIVKKIKSAREYNQQKDIIAEIIILGYFCKKFSRNKNINIIFERKVNINGKNVDISLKNNTENYHINIDVAVLHDDQKIQKQKKGMIRGGLWGWFSIEENKRILRKIIEKLKKGQFPSDKNEFNFVWMIHSAIADEIDFAEAVLGTETGVMSEDKLISRCSNKDGLIHKINENNYSFIHGVIYSKWDVFSHKVLKNPSIQIDDKIYEIID